MKPFTRNVLSGALIGTLSFFASGSTLAHHSYAMFDLASERQVSGAVRNFEWTNPHVWLWITVSDEHGTPGIFGFEGTSPSEMRRRSGWTKNTVSIGEKVTVKYHPLRDGQRGGRIVSVTLANGRTLDASSGVSLPLPSSNPAKH